MLQEQDIPAEVRDRLTLLDDGFRLRDGPPIPMGRLTLGMALCAVPLAAVPLGWLGLLSLGLFTTESRAAIAVAGVLLPLLPLLPLLGRPGWARIASAA